MDKIANPDAHNGPFRQFENRSFVSLTDNITKVYMSEQDREDAIRAAHWRFCSPHEWEWTPKQQANMALYVLWAAQRLSVLESVSRGDNWANK